jgi:4-hydroxy-tetrahydrodipicolinate reductase
MKIALLGYGKMGRAIEEIALEKGHEIVLRVSIENLEDNTIEKIRRADVAIEFTGPESAYENLLKCFDAEVPVVCGSTGWLDKMEQAKKYCTEHNGALLYASNFSVGVNIFFAVNQHLASLMASRDDYKLSMREIHHTQKKDAPSGTAITLAEQIIKNIPRIEKWVENGNNSNNELPIISERIDPVPGIHSIRYDSEVDTIEIIHTAHSRKGFASGAVLAAEFLAGKKGVFTMKDVLGV